MSIEHPCFKCKHHKYGIDVSDETRTLIGGIYCCCAPITGRVMILDKSVMTFIRELGCTQRELK